MACVSFNPAKLLIDGPISSQARLSIPIQKPFNNAGIGLLRCAGVTPCFTLNSKLIQKLLIPFFLFWKKEIDLRNTCSRERYLRMAHPWIPPSTRQRTSFMNGCICINEWSSNKSTPHLRKDSVTHPGALPVRLKKQRSSLHKSTLSKRKQAEKTIQTSSLGVAKPM